MTSTYAVRSLDSSSPARDAHWFALKVRTRSEPAAEAALRAKGIRSWLPKRRERRRYSDRFKLIETAMFPGYVFCEMNPRQTLPALTVPSVQYIVGNGAGPVPVPDQEITSLQKAADSGADPTPFITAGQRVRIRYGNLEGVEGILVRHKGGVRLVLSVEILRRSVSVEVDEDQVEILS